jgi:hypothetical protein
MDREGDNVYANEMSIREAATVYELLGAPANLTLLHRPGDHHGYNSITNYFDWLDERLARPHVDPDAPPVAPMVYLTPAGFDWARWQRRANASTADAPPAAAPLATRVAWLLDTTAPQLPAAAGIPDSYNEEAAPGTFARVLLSHEGAPINGSKAHANISSVPFSFGAYVSADAYFDRGAIERAAWPGGGLPPVVIWLHGYGYNRGYDTQGNNTGAFLDLAAAGFVVIAYDQIGFGIRLAEGGAAFYRRYPRGASLLGKMVTDVSALVDALYCFGPRGRADGGRCFWAGSYSGSARAAAAVPALDDRKVLVAGYALGGTVALYAGALDARVTGVASVAGFTPMRTDSADRGTGGLARLASMHALAPRLGLYVGDEASVPFDYGELLAAIAPRPTLLYTPKRDRDATFADVAVCVDEVRPAWGASGALRNPRPDDYSRLSPEAAAALVEWAKAAVT